MTRSPSHSEQVAWNDAWIARDGRHELVLKRPGKGLTLSLSGPSRRVANTMRALFAEPASRQLLSQFPARERKLAVELIRRYQILRPCFPGNPPLVVGRGKLAHRLHQLTSTGQWRVPPLHVMRTARELEEVGRRPQLRVLAYGDRLWALGSGVCGRCLLFRAAAHQVNPNERPSLALTPRSPKLLTTSHLTEFLLGLEGEHSQLGSESVVLAAAWGEEAHLHRLLPHPDCVRCTPPEVLRRRRSQVGRVLHRTRDQVDETIRRALCDGALGPIELHQAEVGGLQNKPFIWGSVFLVRKSNDGVANVSTAGGIYCAHGDPELRQTVAVSEGVERLSARGARPDEWVRATQDARAIRPSTLFARATARDDHGTRPYCTGFDLITQRPCLVPWEAVGVDLPKDIHPTALRSERFYSGAASHRSLVAAAVHATIELFKRDAYLISWYRRRALTRLSWPKVSNSVIQRRANLFRSHGIDIELFDLRLQLPLPTLLLRLTARRRVGNWPRGGSLLTPCGGWTPLAALEHGLGLAEGQFASFAQDRLPLKNPLDPVQVRRFARLARFWPLLARYLDPKNSHHHSHLGAQSAEFESIAGYTPNGPAEEVALFKKWIRQAGLRWVLVRLTDEATERAGFETVKVVIPGLLLASPKRSLMELRLERMERPWPGALSDKPIRAPHPLY